MTRPAPRSTLFPYTTLFRSRQEDALAVYRRTRRTLVEELGVEPSEGLKELRSEEHTSELQSHHDLVCRLLLEKKKKICMKISLGQMTAEYSSGVFRVGFLIR